MSEVQESQELWTKDRDILEKVRSRPTSPTFSLPLQPFSFPLHLRPCFLHLQLFLCSYTSNVFHPTPAVFVPYTCLQPLDRGIGGSVGVPGTNSPNPTGVSRS